jgi:2,3-bisphosphoglycerate-independent phosphoglycerate mutase
MAKRKKVVLIIMDGWGLGKKDQTNAIYNADTPFVNGLLQKHPHSQLLTSGKNVGLPEGQMGNSEVGHINIGAGRIVYQELERIDIAIETGELKSNPVLNELINYAKENNKPLHLMGLVSDGGVHSHINHLKALCDIAAEKGMEMIFIHAFTDGRDTDPKSGIKFINELQRYIVDKPVKIASLTGRYYAMDRDRRWERIKMAYDLLIKGIGKKTKNLIDEIERSYADRMTDEFIKPVVVVDDDNIPLITIKEGDAVLVFNFRTDRCRQITRVLTQQDMPDYDMKKLNLFYVTMSRYDDDFQNVKVIFEKENPQNTLGEVLARNGKKQLRIAETEKYPHVTYFFSGGREEVFTGENRILIPSPKVATYDLKPSMSAEKVTDAIVKELKKGEIDFVCLNYANPDMVGHTGVYEAIVEAVETVDQCVKRVVESGTENGYSFLITSDHGNADYVINEDGSPNTAHTTNPVPLILIDNDYKKINNGILADLAPTILKIMEIEKPDVMTGNVLI